MVSQCSIIAVEFLPYHSTGYEKAKRLGLKEQHRFETPNDEGLKAIIDCFSDPNVRVVK